MQTGTSHICVTWMMRNVLLYCVWDINYGTKFEPLTSCMDFETTEPLRLKVPVKLSITH